MPHRCWIRHAISDQVAGDGRCVLSLTPSPLYTHPATRLYVRTLSVAPLEPTHSWDVERTLKDRTSHKTRRTLLAGRIIGAFPGPHYSYRPHHSGTRQGVALPTWALCVECWHRASRTSGISRSTTAALALSGPRADRRDWVRLPVASGSDQDLATGGRIYN